MLLIPAGSSVDQIIHFGTTALGGLIALIFAWRVIHHIRSVGDKLNLNILARGEKSRFDPQIQARRYGKFRRKKYMKRTS
jgi:hypothetical protein